MYYKINPSISFHIWVPTHIEIKGPCQVSPQELTSCLSADITCYEKQKVVEAFGGICLCLKAQVKCKCKHKALRETMLKAQRFLDALQLCQKWQ